MSRPRSPSGSRSARPRTPPAQPPSRPLFPRTSGRDSSSFPRSLQDSRLSSTAAKSSNMPAKSMPSPLPSPQRCSPSSPTSSPATTRSATFFAYKYGNEHRNQKHFRDIRGVIRYRDDVGGMIGFFCFFFSGTKEMRRFKERKTQKKESSVTRGYRAFSVRFRRRRHTS